MEAVKEVLNMSQKDCEFPASTLTPNFNSENKVSFSTSPPSKRQPSLNYRKVFHCQKGTVNW